MPSLSTLQNGIFTLTVTVISRALILRDRLLRRLRPPDAADPQCLTSTHRLRSGANLLDARFVAPVHGPANAGLLLCHGVGETVEHWAGVQQFLAREGIASLVFNYSGYGRSTGRISVQQCERDARAAFACLRRLVPAAPLSLLGYSLGSGVATAVAPELAPARLILCAAFSSLRDAAASLGVPRLLCRLLPPLWSNVAALRSARVSVLVLHGAADRLFPPAMAHELGAACSSPCEVVVVPGLTHNGPMYQPDAAFWSIVARRL